jgi:hypothetical protein
MHQNALLTPAGREMMVSRVLARLGLDQRRAREPAAPVVRDAGERPGEMLPLDIKKRGRFDRVGPRLTGERTGQSDSRGSGGEYLPVAIDDAAQRLRPDPAPCEG